MACALIGKGKFGNGPRGNTAIKLEAKIGVWPPQIKGFGSGKEESLHSAFWGTQHH